MNKTKKKGAWKSVVWCLMLFVVGVLCGALVTRFLDFSFLEGLSPRMTFLAYILLILVVWLAYLSQVILHEAGHLVFGLLSGYSFSSFRIGKTMLVKKGGKLQIKRFFLAGTGGQCLMIPPEETEKKPPVVALFLGGCIFNLVFGTLFLAIAFLLSDTLPVMLFFGASGLIGILSAFLNGIPLQTALIVNDGANALAMKRDTEAAREFCRHLYINAQSVEGVRLRELPAEWFTPPCSAQLQNSAFAERAVFACNRLMDEGKYEEAALEIRRLLECESAVAGVHRKLLVCDLIFCELIGERRAEVLGELYTREQYNFMRTMKDFPSVIRTEYAYAKLYQHDGKKAQMLREAFEKSAKTYPNEGDLLTEREIMRYVSSKRGDYGEHEDVSEESPV